MLPNAFDEIQPGGAATPPPMEKSHMSRRSSNHLIPLASRRRTVGLLNMKYTIGQLADRLQVSAETINLCINLGCPTMGDMIGGHQFRDWYKSYFRKTKLTITEKQTYCVGCRSIITMPKKRETRVAQGCTFLAFACPKCGRTATKIIKGVGR